jgi:hypothetical protein
MDQLKRKSNFNQSNKDKMKKLRSKSNEYDQSVTCIEKLSNEIFDYLNGCAIKQAFGNLNYRFEQLLKSPSLLFKFNFDRRPNELDMDIYKRMIDFNQHQILSINLWMVEEDIAIITASTINSLFSNLESLTLGEIEPDILLPLLSHLALLPRLFSLFIMRLSGFQELSDCYVLIFNLPKLKYLRFHATGYRHSNIIVSPAMPPSQSISTIEYLVIDHLCTSQDLANIISYTRHLSHLTVSDQ